MEIPSIFAYLILLAIRVSLQSYNHGIFLSHEIHFYDFLNYITIFFLKTQSIVKTIYVISDRNISKI